MRRSSGVSLLFLFALLLAAPAEGQETPRCAFCKPLISADVGVLHNEFVTEPVLELYASAETFLPYVRPYVILSWTPLVGEEDNPEQPTIVTQVAYPVYARGPVWATLDAGATWYPFQDYEPEFTAGSFVGVGLPIPRTNAFGLVSFQPLNDWDWSFIGGIGYTLYRDG